MIAQSTVNAAKALNRPELGTFKTGAVGDVTLLRIDTGSYDYIDVKGETLMGDRKIELDGVVLNGKWWHTA